MSFSSSFHSLFNSSTPPSVCEDTTTSASSFPPPVLHGPDVIGRAGIGKFLESVTEDPYKLKQLQEDYKPVSSSLFPSTAGEKEGSFIPEARLLPFTPLRSGPRSDVFEAAWSESKAVPSVAVLRDPSPHGEVFKEGAYWTDMPQEIRPWTTIDPGRHDSWSLEFLRRQQLAIPSDSAEEFQPADPTVVWEQANSSFPVPSSELDRARARQLVGELKLMGDPKLNTSEFVKFVEKFAEGTVNVLPGSTRTSWESVYQGKEEVDNVESALQELEATWGHVQQQGEISNKERDLFNSVFNEDDLQEPFKQSWNEPDMLEQTWSRGETESPPYIFQKDNPFLEYSPNGLVSCTLGSALTEGEALCNAGRYDEALLTFEAEVQANPESSEGWRCLGQLLADMEQDVDAIICLKKGHQVDPYNLDSLLALGVSLTNELDAPQALRYLRTWLAHHDEFQPLPHLSGPAPVNYNDLKSEVVELFTQAARLKLNDPHLLTALGVVHSIVRDYPQALDCFSKAVKCSPASLKANMWNKLGATLANSGRSEAALGPYHEALAMRPNYPRTWSNMAISYANLNRSDEAVRFYLSALRLNLKAVHLWQHIHTIIINTGRYDLLELVDQRDINALSIHFPGVVDPRELPEPALFSSRDEEGVIARVLQSVR